MLSLTQQDIVLNQSARDKTAAISALASELTQQGLVSEGYVKGMLAREAQNSTFLGSGIAIPHGTTDTRDLVQQTGVKIHHYPQGVNWGDGNTVYLAIGIAAKSDEHLGILKQLTKVLSADGVAEQIRQSNTAEALISLLNGDTQLEADFDESLIALHFPATDLLQLTAVAAGLIKNKQAADNAFVADVIAEGASYLGQGLWLARSSKGVNRTTMSFVTPSQDIIHQEQSTHQEQPVKGLLMLAACNAACHKPLNLLAQKLYQNQLHTLFEADAAQLPALLTDVQPAVSDEANTAVFKIRNAHGLHARPGAMLVSVAKKFESAIQVKNLQGDGKSVNAKSLMKVIALGVKHGHELEFMADGSDAPEALSAIGDAIAAGLGEGR
ncbi:fused PTS fructose transporter subunit IIA/HPr protein [Photobacterium sp. WH77]|uniref:fused PTS fructose transporter subunit IIA/HPr protein n=1 Tax=unclassified Photobacterium TaxID=2628852 RepID=UPI001EDA2363|nr:MULTISPECIES: fused PTS fructose transporter subunit IIA/HPr protein [unclassified Photobacterium]MCG2836307.1 fused PTS fructose transporter subunit IIA/HPr protein [Photobacterium sp. WH77]MCG2844066.1 fused PTS fructose transporter subunit IIA/HPr protein [Photobacterium sp. WH80]MDO6580492.1 fused PTS fructose transporter subunit IIA/HPr protein [Photobacterium sp. 2_MG-2023]